MQKNERFKVVFALLAIVAFSISIWARLTPRFPGDLYLAARLQSLDGRFFLFVARDASFMFDGWPAILLGVVVAIVVWWRAGRLEAGVVLGGGFLAALTNTLLKVAVDRPRPSPELVQVFSPEKDPGFPSGHALYAVVVLGLVVYFCFVSLRSRSLQMLILASMIALVLIVGVSRVYLGAHWPSDVLGGYVVGGVLFVGLVWFHRVFRRQTSPSRDESE